MSLILYINLDELGRIATPETVNLVKPLGVWFRGRFIVFIDSYSTSTITFKGVYGAILSKGRHTEARVHRGFGDTLGIHKIQNDRVVENFKDIIDIALKANFDGIVSGSVTIDELMNGLHCHLYDRMKYDPWGNASSSPSVRGASNIQRGQIDRETRRLEAVRRGEREHEDRLRQLEAEELNRINKHKQRVASIVAQSGMVGLRNPKNCMILDRDPYGKPPAEKHKSGRVIPTVEVDKEVEININFKERTNV